MKVLVTGSSGYIGRSLCSAMDLGGYEVLGLDTRAGPATTVVGDITQLASLREALVEIRPQAVVHLAALASVPECESNPLACIETNIRGTMNVARVAAEVGARFVFASTAAVYGGAQIEPSRVDQPLRPDNAYGASKAVGEEIVARISSDYAILRLFNVYGGPCERSYVIPDVIRKVHAAEAEVHLFGSGRESRDFVHVSDVISAFTLALSGPSSGVYNVATGHTTPIRRLVARIAELMGRPWVRFRFDGKRPGDFDQNYGSIVEDNVLPSWTPRVPLNEGLKETIQSVAPAS